MTDLFHFLASGSLLTALTASPLVTGTLTLLLGWSAHPYLSLRIFKRLATFLRQVSQDNPTVGGALWSAGLDEMVGGVLANVTKENAEFAAELLGFHV